MMITIRAYKPSDANLLTDMFYQTVHSVGQAHYTPAELAQWAVLPIDYELWQTKMDDHRPWVAVIGEELVGFMSLNDSGLIHWAFTHKNHQRKGIAAKLYDHIEALAKAKNISTLSSQASYFAQPFFEKRGFTTLKRNENKRGDQVIVNFSMIKTL